MIGDGTLVLGLNWPIALTATLALLVVRPIAAWVSLLASLQPTDEKAIIGFFGICGLGSLYYMASGTSAATFSEEATLWSTLFLVILA